MEGIVLQLCGRRCCACRRRTQSLSNQHRCSGAELTHDTMAHVRSSLALNQSPQAGLNDAASVPFCPLTSAVLKNIFYMPFRQRQRTLSVLKAQDDDDVALPHRHIVHLHGGAEAALEARHRRQHHGVAAALRHRQQRQHQRLHVLPAQPPRHVLHLRARGARLWCFQWTCLSSHPLPLLWV